MEQSITPNVLTSLKKYFTYNTFFHVFTIKQGCTFSKYGIQNAPHGIAGVCNGDVSLNKKFLNWHKNSLKI